MSKRKITLKLNPGEVCVVADVDYFNHMIEVYDYMAELCPEEKEFWGTFPAIVQEWIDKTAEVYSDQDINNVAQVS